MSMEIQKLMRQTLRDEIIPAMRLLPAKMYTQEAVVMLLSIAGQESGLVHQKQIGGPARGVLMFETGGGVAGVMQHPQTKDLCKKVCDALGVKFDKAAISHALSGQEDALDFALARLLLWTDAAPLPKVSDQQGGWDYYLRTWRPGKPRPEHWQGWYSEACRAIVG